MKFKHGQWFTALISNIPCKGKVSIQPSILISEPRIFLCQDNVLGSPCLDKQGYAYSWTINDGSNYTRYHVSKLKLYDSEPEMPDFGIIKMKPILTGSNCFYDKNKKEIFLPGRDMFVKENKFFFVYEKMSQRAKIDIKSIDGWNVNYDEQDRPDVIQIGCQRITLDQIEDIVTEILALKAGVEF